MDGHEATIMVLERASLLRRQHTWVVTSTVHNFYELQVSNEYSLICKVTVGVKSNIVMCGLCQILVNLIPIWAATTPGFVLSGVQKLKITALLMADGSVLRTSIG